MVDLGQKKANSVCLFLCPNPGWRAILKPSYLFQGLTASRFPSFPNGCWPFSATADRFMPKSFRVAPHLKHGRQVPKMGRKPFLPSLSAFVFFHFGRKGLNWPNSGGAPFKFISSRPKCTASRIFFFETRFVFSGEP